MNIPRSYKRAFVSIAAAILLAAAFPGKAFPSEPAFSEDQEGNTLQIEHSPVSLTEEWSLDGLSAASSDGGAPLLGDPGSLTASASGNASSLEYKFVWEKGGWSSWGTVRDFAADPSCAWTPEAAGDLNIWVDVRDSAGRVSSSVYPVHVDAARVQVSGGLVQPWSGQMLSLSARGAAGATYKFVWEKGGWSSWGVISPASDNASCQWAPPCSGDYSVYVDVCAGGSVATEVVPVSLTEEWSLDGLSAASSDGGAPLLGDPGSLTASASGNASSLEYKFVWEKGGWSSWGTVRDFAADPSCAWTPEAAGDLNIWVDVRDSAGRVSSSVYPVHVDRNIVSFDSISIESKSDTITAGDAISIVPNCQIRNKVGIAYKYVWERDDWADWGVIDSGEGLDCLEWAVSRSGSITIFVDAIDQSTGQVVSSNVDLSVTPETWKYDGLSADMTYLQPGQPAVFNAQVSGVTDYLTYKFVWSKNDWASWGVAQIGESDTLTWIPDEPGEYEIYCDVCGSDGIWTSKHVAIGVWGYVGVSAISTDGNRSWDVRADMGTLMAEQTGDFTFKFVWAKTDWSKWGVLKGASTTNDAYFCPSDLGLGSGYYDLYVDVTFPDGTIQTKKTKIYYNPYGSDTVLGVRRLSLVMWLTSHQFDGYYLGTRYSGGFSYDTCLYPNGSPRWDGYTGMNCTGFVAHAYASVGGNVGAIAYNNSHSPWAGGPGGGGYINAWRWYGYACDYGCKMYEFGSVQEMLNSGYAQKGDIIFFKTNGSIDCHIGFFWGDTPYENKMWHQILPGNLIGPCFNNANKSEYNQTVVLIK